MCSLNLSKPGKKTHSKLVTVTRNGPDIIFLSDTRLNSDTQIAGVNYVEKKCKFLGYTVYHNSHLNSRGTAILITNKLNFTIVDSYKDDECNIILLKIRMCGINITVGSIYGPNIDNEQFFITLRDKISYLNSDFTIIGGDWNTTLDQRNCAANIDTYNTVGIPSARRSAWLNQFCTDLSLKDPYRYFYPETREFTYVPYNVNATNRSRLDFFLFPRIY